MFGLYTLLFGCGQKWKAFYAQCATGFKMDTLLARWLFEVVLGIYFVRDG